MRLFRRKKKKEDEGLQKSEVSPEIQKMVESLRNKIDTQEAQITTFREDIAPQMAETIHGLKNEIERLNKLLKEREEELVNQNDMIKKISSSSAKLQKEGATELLIKAQNEARIYKSQVLEQSKVIVDLQQKIDYIPIICSRLVDEINMRNASIQNLSNQLETIKAENIRLSLDALEIEKRLEETLRSIEEKEDETRKILSSINV